MTPGIRKQRIPEVLSALPPTKSWRFPGDFAAQGWMLSPPEGTHSSVAGVHVHHPSLRMAIRSNQPYNSPKSFILTTSHLTHSLWLFFPKPEASRRIIQRHVVFSLTDLVVLHAVVTVFLQGLHQDCPKCLELRHFGIDMAFGFGQQYFLHSYSIQRQNKTKLSLRMTNHFNWLHGSWKSSQPGVSLWCLLELQEWIEDHHLLTGPASIFRHCLSLLHCLSASSNMASMQRATSCKIKGIWLRPNKHMFSTMLYSSCRHICRHSGIAQLLWWFLPLAKRGSKKSQLTSLGHRTLASLGIASPNRLSPENHRIVGQAMGPWLAYPIPTI